MAWVSPEAFDSAFINLEEKIIADNIQFKYTDAKVSLSNDIVDTIFQDKKSRVNKNFTIPKYFNSSVRFWFSIYTQYTSKQVVIHDKKFLDLIYNIIDFEEIHNSKINRYAKSHIQTKLTLEYTRKIKQILRQLSTANFKKLNSEQYEVLKTIRSSSAKVPITRKARKRFFRRLSGRLRSQTGQRNMVYQGMLRSLPYFSFLSSTINSFKIPKELLAISFLESSFNPKAISKADAVGVWQFMKYTNNLIMPKITPNLDTRRNPIVSSISAFHLLKENRMILRRWDLAVTAYNSGTRNLINARKRYGKTHPLSYILKNYKHASLGFASKNFYAEFLALTRVLAYKNMIFPLRGHEDLRKTFNLKNGINLYISKCSIKPKKFFQLLKKSSPRIAELNSHFIHPHKTYPRGSFIVSDINLKSRRYYKLSIKQIKKRFPKHYYKLIKNKKCRR
jgi:membrane-bound lytic murein transglycosylase D